MKTTVRRHDLWRHVGVSALALAGFLLLGVLLLEVVSITSSEIGRDLPWADALVRTLIMTVVVSGLAVALPTLLTGRISSVRDAALSTVVLLVLTTFVRSGWAFAVPDQWVSHLVLTLPFAVLVCGLASATVYAWERRRRGLPVMPRPSA